jgi:hypothetical protein
LALTPLETAGVASTQPSGASALSCQCRSSRWLSTVSSRKITMPVAEYSHSDGCSVTGGYVYRGAVMPELQGTYFYGDYCTGFVKSFRISAGIATSKVDWTSTLHTQSGGAMTGLSSFGLDGKGELYLVRLSGEVYRLAPKP